MSTSTPDLPEFDVPFRLGPDGQIATVEQESVAEITAGAVNVLVCPQGARIDNPEFGALAGMLFGSLPVDLTALQTALGDGEPRADYSLTEIALLAQTATELISVQVLASGETAGQ